MTFLCVVPTSTRSTSRWHLVTFTRGVMWVNHPDPVPEFGAFS
ncbi:hypothetical protein BN903_101 [Halorubrum sp. AJ67]|nr:hypothetical protein BN903_101 [Halorubrum sp. AJ67]